MPSALSVDLRERVVAAVEEGASRRQAAKRFGVSPTSAIRWYERFIRDRRVAPKPMGGDQRSQTIEAQADLIVSTYEAKLEIFLPELQEKLAERGLRLGVLKQGDTVILDNLPAHKIKGVREAIDAVGASLLYLPA